MPAPAQSGDELLQILSTTGEEHGERRRELSRSRRGNLQKRRGAEQVTEPTVASPSWMKRHGNRVGLDKRLGQMASNTVSSTRKQLENAVDSILVDMAPQLGTPETARRHVAAEGGSGSSKHQS
jgi:hypothetical protein